MVFTCKDHQNHATFFYQIYYYGNYEANFYQALVFHNFILLLNLKPLKQFSYEKHFEFFPQKLGFYDWSYFFVAATYIFLTYAYFPTWVHHVIFWSVLIPVGFFLKEDDNDPFFRKFDILFPSVALFITAILWTFPIIMFWGVLSLLAGLLPFVNRISYNNWWSMIYLYAILALPLTFNFGQVLQQKKIFIANTPTEMVIVDNLKITNTDILISVKNRGTYPFDGQLLRNIKVTADKKQKDMFYINNDKIWAFRTGDSVKVLIYKDKVLLFQEAE